MLPEVKMWAVSYKKNLTTHVGQANMGTEQGNMFWVAVALRVCGTHKRQAAQFELLAWNPVAKDPWAFEFINRSFEYEEEFISV